MRRLLQNINSNLLVFFVTVAIVFVMTPITLRHLGNYDYGIWELLLSVVGYMGLLDLGLSPTVSRFIAKFNAEENWPEVEKVYSSSFFLLGIAGLIAGTIFIVWGLYFSSNIAPDGEANLWRYSATLIIVGVQLLIVFPGIVAVSVIEGLQEYRKKNNIIILLSVLGSAVIIATINDENALMLIAAVSLIGNIVKYVYYFWFLHKSKDFNAKLKRSCISRRMIRKLLSFGLKAFVQGTTARLSRYSDNFVIAAFVGPASIVFFAIPSAVLRHVLSLLMNITTSFMPYFSDLAARKEMAEISRVYLLASKVTLAITYLLLAGILVFGDDFIRLWIGNEYAIRGHNVLIILIAYFFIYSVTPFDNRLVTALGKHGFYAKMGVVDLIINLVLSVFLVQFLGIEGVALGTLLAAVVFKFYTLRYCCHVVGIGSIEYLKQCVFPNLIPGIAVVGFLSFVRWFHGSLNWTWLLVYSLAAGVLWFVLFLFLTLSKGERDAMNRMVWQRLSRVI